MRNFWSRRRFVLGGLTLPLYVARIAHGLAADSGEAGAAASYAVSISDAPWHDAQRNRLLPVKLRVPQGARHTPVILFSHGLGGSREGGKVWSEHWATFGYLVVHIQHPGSDHASQPAYANSLQQYLARIQDVRFVLDELQRRQLAHDPLLAQADLTRIGMSGHSFGAQTTLALSGMRLGHAVENGDIPFDARVGAALAFCPTTAGPETTESDYAFRFGSMLQPFMTITGTDDGEPSSIGYAWQNRQIPYQYMPGPGKYLLVLKGADHWVYVGQPGVPRTVRPQDAVITRWTKLATTAFWDAHLKSDMNARAWLDSFAGSLGGAGTFAQK